MNKITNEEKAMDIGDNYYDNDKSYTAQEAALEMAEWKDEYFNEMLKETLLNYTIWLDKRGAFREDLCIDWEHQIETFLELEKSTEEKQSDNRQHQIYDDPFVE